MAAPDALVPVPERRLPTVDVGRITMPEGDGPGRVTARMPFEVHGDVTAPARLAVTTVGGSPAAQAQHFTIDLAPGRPAARSR